jgi:nickel-dependent lactate racemase
MNLSLRYGRSAIGFDAPADRIRVIGETESLPALTDAAIGERFDSPIGTGRIEDIVAPGESVLIVVPDATRLTACDSIVNLLVRRLIANGTMPYDIAIVFATGIHRPVTTEEKKQIVTPFIYQRIKTLDHNARDLMRRAGLDSDRFSVFEVDGRTCELNRILSEYDRLVLVGGITFHYFAGFTGGRKLICPGLASEETIAATHRLAFDFEKRTRRAGVGPGLLDGNAVHAAFERIAEMASPDFAVNTIVDDDGGAVDVFCGHWRDSHRAACDAFADRHIVRIEEKRETVIVSCGGFPYDANLIQAHKALDAAARACLEGGTIVLVAECAEGLGRADFLKWFERDNSAGIAEMLCEGYEVNGQTAWSLRDKTERFNVLIKTSLDARVSERIGLRPIEDLAGLPTGSGYVLPFGAKFLVRS